jgi:hypothetical protein
MASFQKLQSFSNNICRFCEGISEMEAETKKNAEPRFTPKTIVDYNLIAAAVFATAKDRKGKPLFPRQGDLNYIGLPAVVKRARIRTLYAYGSSERPAVRRRCPFSSRPR